MLKKTQPAPYTPGAMNPLPHIRNTMDPRKKGELQQRVDPQSKTYLEKVLEYESQIAKAQQPAPQQSMAQLFASNKPPPNPANTRE
jgi:hypothetical protein